MNADLLADQQRRTWRPTSAPTSSVMRARRRNALRTGPLVFTDCRHGDGLQAVLAWLLAELDASATAVGASGVRLWVD